MILFEQKIVKHFFITNNKENEDHTKVFIFFGIRIYEKVLNWQTFFYLSIKKFSIYVFLFFSVTSFCFSSMNKRKMFLYFGYYFLYIFFFIYLYLCHSYKKNNNNDKNILFTYALGNGWTKVYGYNRLYMRAHTQLMESYVYFFFFFIQKDKIRCQLAGTKVPQTMGEILKYATDITDYNHAIFL